MPVTGKLNGTLVKLWADGNEIAYATNVSFDLSAAEVDTTNKDSSGYRGVRPGLISGTAKVQGFAGFGGDQNVLPFEDFRSSRSVFTLDIFFANGTGDKYLQGSVRMTDFSLSAGVEDNLTFDASFKFTGAISWNTQS